MNIVKDSLRSKHIDIWKSSETQDPIYVGPFIGHSHVNRLDKNPFVRLA